MKKSLHRRDITLFYPALMLTVPLCFLVPQPRALRLQDGGGENGGESC